MANHFAAIGFEVGSEQEMTDLVIRAAHLGEPLDTDNGTYISWALGNGVELWVQANLEGEIIGLNPHFSGIATMRVGLTERVLRDDGTLLDGAFHGWADPATSDPESGLYPFVFDTPDHELYRRVLPPVIYDVQLAAFAHELVVHADETAFRDSRENGLPLAVESFIPSGLFTGEDGDGDIPRADAIFSGHVIAAALMHNPDTGKEFHWARVQTYGGEIDVVADIELIEETILPGAIVSGAFWLSGRLRDYPKATRQSFWGGVSSN